MPGAASNRPDLVAKVVFSCDADGNPVTPQLGETFYVGMRYEVRGDLKAPYFLTVDAGFAKLESTTLTFGQGQPGDYWVAWGPVTALTDDPISITAALKPSKALKEVTTKNNVLKLQVLARRPSQGVEWFGRNALLGSMRLDVTWNLANLPQNPSVWWPRAQTETFQSTTAESLPPSLSTLDAENTESPWVGAAPLDGNRLALESNWTTSASAQRVNRDILEAATFDAYLNEPIDFSKWLGAEVHVNPNDAAIQKFAQKAAKSASNLSSPYLVARALYAATIKHLRYVHAPGNSPNASKAYKLKKGDCGAFAALFAASCRVMKVPARTVAGFVAGDDKWHVWAEFYLPQYGWIACDPSYADSYDPTGKCGLYFGVMPDLNTRVATSFGFDQTWNGQTLGLLQSPSVFWSNSAQLINAESHCSLKVQN